jgi:NadR type nicotinamide-nucleotide adenylyltransferase
MIRGLITGAFDPPHAGHVQLARTAQTLCDQLTILVHRGSHVPRVPPLLRARWMGELVPGARIVASDRAPPPAPPPDQSGAEPGAMTAWHALVAEVHPEPVDLLFAGQDSGGALAATLGARFVPLGNRLLQTDKHGLGVLSSDAIRSAPFAHWRYLPPMVRAWFAPLIVLHGVESTGKSMMANRLAWLYDTLTVGEFGRAECEWHGTQTSLADLERIGTVQTAMIEEARPWCRQRLFADTDALMTIAWARMQHGVEPDSLWQHPRGDLYLLLEPDVPFVADRVRLYGDADRRRRFHAIAEQVLEEAGVRTVSISGSGWEQRFERAAAAVEGVGPRH